MNKEEEQKATFNTCIVRGTKHTPSTNINHLGVEVLDKLKLLDEKVQKILEAVQEEDLEDGEEDMEETESDEEVPLKKKIKNKDKQNK